VLLNDVAVAGTSTREIKNTVRADERHDSPSWCFVSVSGTAWPRALVKGTIPEATQPTQAKSSHKTGGHTGVSTWAIDGLKECQNNEQGLDSWSPHSQGDDQFQLVLFRLSRRWAVGKRRNKWNK
jgi:hypothetical protein